MNFWKSLLSAGKWVGLVVTGYAGFTWGHQVLVPPKIDIIPNGASLDIRFASDGGRFTYLRDATFARSNGARISNTALLPLHTAQLNAQSPNQWNFTEFVEIYEGLPLVRLDRPTRSYGSQSEWHDQVGGHLHNSPVLLYIEYTRVPVSWWPTSSAWISSREFFMASSDE